MSFSSNRSILRFIYFLGVIRWYNLILLAVSQYILSAYILLLQHGEQSKKLAFWFFLTDTTVHGMVLATIFTVASIFIINAFYDKEKDWVNKPGMALMSQAIGSAQLANLYILFNTIGLVFAVLASVKAALFFLGIQFFGWFYSHKLQKKPFLRELSAGMLTIAPLVAIWIHFSMPKVGLITLFTGLLTLLTVKDILKDVSGHRGNLIFGYHTVVKVTGLNQIKRWVLLFTSTALLVFTLISTFWPFSSNQKPYDIIAITGIALLLTWLNSIVWLVSKSDITQKWCLRLQKLFVVALMSGLFIIIIYRYVLFFLYDKVAP